LGGESGGGKEREFKKDVLQKGGEGTANGLPRLSKKKIGASEKSCPVIKNWLKKEENHLSRP